MKGCVLDLKMRDKQGSVVTDYSRYGNDGVVNGGVVWAEQGMRFDGSSGYLDCGNDASLKFESSGQDFSVFAWIKKNAIATTYICDARDGGDDGWSFRFVSNYLWLQLNNIDLKSSATITDDLWHSVGAVINRGGNGQIYIDGVADGSPLAMGSQAMSITNNLFIGTQYNGAYFFNGNIDQVQIYNYALPLREIKAMYNAEKHKYI